MWQVSLTKVPHNQPIIPIPEALNALVEMMKPELANW